MSGCRIQYEAIRDYAKADEKGSFLQATPFDSRRFDGLKPDLRSNWINLVENDFESFLPIADKKTKATTVTGQERAIFQLYSLGISTNRDEWLYDFERENLARKSRALVKTYNCFKADESQFPETIKWSRNLKRRLVANRRESFSNNRLVRASYRPFARRWLYQSDLFIDEAGSSAQMFPLGRANAAICFSDIGSRTNYCVQAIDGLADLHFGASVDAYQQVPRFRYINGEQSDNITDWALEQFRANYAKSLLKNKITKDAIFRYVYAVLHDPIYREKYELNLIREFPRVPFHADFWKWAGWGKKLMELHIGYETVEAWPLKRIDAPDEKSRKAGLGPKAMLKANKESGNIRLDSETQLTGVPPVAWTYKLGNRSALEWILDQYKEKTPKDPTIREKFNAYRFADHKVKVIDLLKRITRVSVETMQIIEAMRSLPR